ncbi:magnesium transporter [Methanococcus vannielii SB]|jgi:magnesium transporter|uniref:Magnesium transporter MgtE n=1 Tax=Methanococcus vannielii (strain ATCC 35089 / DSM 1224 / JCM 13029 / OCM 148 / SB) TaxID=406327 RepID=A6US76_METVS|nr:magnesium transporter [Methanococcus vannielii]ABR55348.1 magnesium transporter [Methanococcus vannielii SB]
MIIELQIDVRKYIKNGDLKTLKHLLEDQDPVIIYETIKELKAAEKVVIFRLLLKSVAAEIFSMLEPDEQLELVELFTDEEVKSIIRDMDPSDRAELLDELPDNVVIRILTLLPKDVREKTLEILNYPEDSAGRIMSPNFVYVTRNMTVEGALEKIRRYGKDVDMVYTIFVTEGNRTLIGTINLEELLFAEPKTFIEEIYTPNSPYVRTTTDQEDVATIMKKLDLNAIATVDNDFRLVGVITIDDIVDVIEEEFTEDIHKMAGISTIKTSYFHTSPFSFIKNRLPWLVGLLLVQSLSSFIVQGYEDILTTIPILAAFMVTMVDAGGNTGGQSSTMLIRSLALGEVDLEDWWRVFLKELYIGLILGLVLGIILFIRGFLISSDMFVNLAAGISVLIIIVFANIVGAMLPFLGKMLKIDPALMSGPLITTVADLGGILIYFYIASKILGF